MQKVEGSSPFIRSSESPAIASVLFDAKANREDGRASVSL
jgi:hypothetical protein